MSRVKKLLRLMSLCGMLLTFASCGKAGNSAAAAESDAAPLRVLFIGNSYVYYNDLDLLFKNVCRQSGVEITAERVTKGGHKLIEYARAGDEYTEQIKEKLQSTKYDYVILQEQSTTPILNYDDFDTGVGLLLEQIKENGAQPVLYNTWGRRSDNETLAKYGWTNQSMTEDLASAYGKVGKKYNIPVAYVGIAFYNIYTNHPSENLYNEDGTHPSPYGSKVAAWTLYGKLFGAGNPEDEIISQAVEQALAYEYTE